jgi:hypothetical protein
MFVSLVCWSVTVIDGGFPLWERVLLDVAFPESRCWGVSYTRGLFSKRVVHGEFPKSLLLMIRRGIEETPDNKELMLGLRLENNPCLAPKAIDTSMLNSALHPVA